MIAFSSFIGADISQLINLAAIKAVTQGKSTVSLSIIEETRDDIWMGMHCSPASSSSLLLFTDSIL